MRAALRLDGGHLALDFVNTLGGGLELGPQPHDEHLRSYADLLAWSVPVGTHDESVAGRLASGRRGARVRDRDALAHARLEPGGGVYRWRWEDDDDLRWPLWPLWPLAHATIELLTEGPLDLLKLCHGCRWLFLDRKKNHSRRWCSMEECGTSAKKRRYVERRRALTES